MLSERLDFIAALFQEAGIFQWFVSPGSRNAPIVAALLRNGNFTLHSFPDERSCAFAAMGNAIQYRYPAAFLCTSGSALANAYPAVLEAYYQRIPLLIVSADRPEDRIDQWDGQTIRQNNFFGEYARSSCHINAREYPLKDIGQVLFSTIQKGLEGIQGAVHINIALPEPIYEGIQNPAAPNSKIPAFVYKSPEYPPVLTEEIRLITENKKVMVLVGQHVESRILSDVLERLQERVTVICDITSRQNLFGLKSWDWGLFKRDIPDNLAPDLIITMGMGFISKPLKQALTKWQPQHIHVGLFTEVGNPFQTNPQIWQAHEADFAEAFYQSILPNSLGDSINYRMRWEEFIASQTLKFNHLEEPFRSEAQFMELLLKHLDENTHLHLGNSMSVRYGSWVGNTASKVYSNRGVSGIDGCLSTAVGDALGNPEVPVWVVLGDVSAIYDSNALWSMIPRNLTVVILNNSGGRIFDFIEGPNEATEIRNFVHTPVDFNFEYLAKLHKIPHQRVSIQKVLENLSDSIDLTITGRLIELIHT